MLRRFALILCLTVAGLALGTAPARAVEIDSELQELLLDKNGGAKVPVLMIFEEPADIGDLRTRLDGVSPLERRQLVLDNLRSRAEATQAGVLKFLSAAGRSSRVERVQVLYLAGALSFLSLIHISEPTRLC